ncbi:MAG TPA: hypothetical protein PKY81_15050 [bacterium]|nr:hypothetical protein [bacterium]HPN32267.1 hypothetical protein [bacterium]
MNEKIQYFFIQTLKIFLSHLFVKIFAKNICVLINGDFNLIILYAIIAFISTMYIFRYKINAKKSYAYFAGIISAVI